MPCFACVLVGSKAASTFIEAKRRSLVGGCRSDVRLIWNQKSCFSRPQNGKNFSTFEYRLMVEGGKATRGSWPYQHKTHSIDGTLFKRDDFHDSWLPRIVYVRIAASFLIYFWFFHEFYSTLVQNLITSRPPDFTTNWADETYRFMTIALSPDNLVV